MKFLAKKSLGQNFLHSNSVLDKIIDASDPATTDVVLEIGPGHGALTKKLLTFARRVVAVEKDTMLYAELHETFREHIDSGKLVLIHGDILKFNPETLRIGGSYKLIANIPYNITGAIIEKFLSTSFQPEMMVIMVQKEVADRIIAKNKKTGGPGKESLLSIAIKAYGNTAYICTVKAGNFIPAPSVDSAVIKISDISRDHFINKHHEQLFFQIIKTGFAHKRKTLAGNLKNFFEPDVIDQSLGQACIAHTTRAEDLKILDWFNL